MARVAPRFLALVLVAAAAAPPPGAAAQGGVLVSENPVRSDQVVIAWPAGTAATRVAIYGFSGELLRQATVTAPTNEYVWDLTLGGGTRRVVNGAYIVVVDVDGRRYQRRLFVARPTP